MLRRNGKFGGGIVIDINLRSIVPEFLLNDNNGCAMAAAMKAGLTRMMEIFDQGIACAMDVEKMPEWRLDEMAWETNTLYDYSASVAQKRSWIRDSMPMYMYYGTPYAMERYLREMFGEVRIAEASEYGGDAYHFKISVGSGLTEEKQQFAIKTAEKVKNLRSVLDGMVYENAYERKTYMGCALSEKRVNTFRMDAVEGADV